jgi:hypothetical protein
VGETGKKLAHKIGQNEVRNEKGRRVTEAGIKWRGRRGSNPRPPA